SGQADAIVRLQDDPAAWIENVSGHHALPAHCDATMGLERTINPLGEEVIVLGGIGRNFSPLAARGASGTETCDLGNVLNVY
ncbi:MAG: hypothetical protein ABFD89_19600, partial [Bryobacteraceae bacterium]